MLAVRLGFADGKTEFVDDVHVHGIKDGNLLLAARQPGAGLDADVIRAVPLEALTSVETCERSLHDDSAPEQSTWSMRF